MKHIYIYIILLSISISVFAQSDTLQFKQISIEQGLPHNLVNDFIQDKNGFVWIATQNGISRYDGYNFRTYKIDANSFCGLLSSNIKTFLIDTQGNFWIGTAGGGLHRYDYLADRFISYAKIFENAQIVNGLDIYAIREGSDGSLWIGTYGGGLINFNPKNNNLVQYTHNEKDSTTLNNNDIRSLLFDSHGRLWVGTDGGGLNLFSSKTRQFAHFLHSEKENSLRNNVVMSLHEDSDGDIWVGTYGGGVHRIANGVFPIIQRFMSADDDMSTAIIWSIKEVEKHQIWFATRGSGALIYNKLSGDYRKVVQQSNRTQSIASNLILNVFRDKSGVIWLGTENAGISTLNLYQNKFRRAAPCRHICAVLKRNNVFALAKDQENTFWIGVANNGIYRYQPDYNSVLSIPGRTLEGDINLNTVFAIVTDSTGTIWFGTDGHGLESYNTLTGKHQSFIHDTHNKNSLSNNAVHALLVSRNGLIWIGTYGGGLCRLNPQTKEFRTFSIDREQMKNVVLSLFEDSNGHIWAGTGEKGLARLNEDGSFTFYQSNPQAKGTITNNRVWSIAQTSNKQYLWIGTDGGGLCRMDLATDFFTVYNEKDGLPNDEVMSLLVDKHDNIWIGTLHGLARFSPRSNNFETFTQFDGLTNNQFNQNATFCNSDGKLVFGGIDGIDSFYPDSILYSQFAPPVHITALSIGNSPVEVNTMVKGRVVLPQSIIETEQLSLLYSHTIVSFEFAALDYRSPNSIKYAYKLEGFDEDWVECSANRRYVTYTQLPAGDYTFKVRASNSDGIWSKQYKAIKISIIPPFWKTRWFSILLIISILILIYLVFRLRVLQLKAAKRRLEKAVAEQTDELIKQSGQILLQNEAILDHKELLEQKHNELEEHRKNLEIMVSIRTDELRQALDRANEADMLKTAFLTNMSHEIRTPMNTIMGFADMLSISSLTEEKRHRYVAQIYKNGEALVRIIDDIIDISKIQTGQIRLSKKTTNIGHVLTNAQKYAEDAVFKQNKTLIVSLETKDELNEITTYTDEFRLMQVLINVLNNAAKYTDTGTIDFGAELITQDNVPFVRFYVTDTGRGISEEQRNYVFKSFSKINSRERHYSGAGLGLCIAQNVIELLGGTIWFEPNQPQGTRFYFTVPINYKNDILNIQRVDWRGQKILIAEDDELSYLVLKEMLNFDGIELLWAQNGLEAVKQFDEHAPILVFMDLRMPELDGYQALSAIRSRNPNVPIIAQSAFALLSERDKIMEAGFDDLLSKPINSTTLYSLLSTIFSQEIRKATGNETSYSDMMI